MATVRLEFSLPKKLHSTVKKVDDTTKTTLDHVRRIHIDHDYLKHSSPSETNNQKTAIVDETAHACDGEAKSNIQGSFVTCGSRDVKDGRVGDFPNEGIQASDLCSLLDKFEEAFGNSPSILTPATSPRHSENYKEPLSLKINSHVNTTALTPPTTPPVQEHADQKLLPNDCKPSTKAQKKTELLAKKITSSKKETLTKKAKKVQQKTTGNGSSKVDTLSGEKAKEINCGKRKSNDSIPGSKDTVSSAKKVKVLAENENKILSKVCPEKKIELTQRKDKVDVSSVKTIENSVEKANNETLKKVTCPNAVNLIKEKASELSKSEKNIEHSNDVQEMLGDKKCSNVSEVNEKCPEDVNNVNDKSQNNDKNDQKIEIERTVNNNNEEITEEKIQKGERKDHRDTNGRDEDNWRNRRDTEDTRRKSEDCYVQYKDEGRKRKHSPRSRSISSDNDDSSADERSNPRKSERYQNTSRHSDGGRREKHRRYHSRDDGRYSDDERVRHRNSDHHHDDRHHSKYEKKDRKYFRDIEQERKINFRLGRSNIRDNAKGERRVIYVGGLPYGTTRDELRDRFRKFGPIEKVTVHLRVGERDNYGFVTFFEPEDALECVERGNSDPSKPHFDLCFGGRRQFCGGSYVDFDSTMSNIEEMTETCGKVDDDASGDDDFDSLLRMCQKGLGR